MSVSNADDRSELGLGDAADSRWPSIVYHRAIAAPISGLRVAAGNCYTGEEMNWIDIIILVVAIGSAVSGLAQGAIRTAFGIVGLIAGVYLAGQYYAELSMVLFSGANWGSVVAFFIIWAIVGIAASIGGWFVAKLVHQTPFKWLDRILGAGMGLVLGLLTCAAAIAIIVTYLPSTQETISQSALARFMLQTFPLLLSLLPENFRSIEGLFT